MHNHFTCVEEKQFGILIAKRVVKVFKMFLVWITDLKTLKMNYLYCLFLCLCGEKKKFPTINHKFNNFAILSTKSQNEI